ncbi:hypothetical protein BDY24DRAFT_439304 [Mrakia frigida]|uniref:uncharacterized protein n=1 Tax=Mrakia frigida TaxID=29902 RepID=UPI003FCC1998
MVPHCPTNDTDVSSLLTVALLFFSMSKHGVATCTSCKKDLTLASNPVYNECPKCYDKAGPKDFRPWTTRSRPTRLQDRVGTCPALKLVGNFYEVCSAELRSETQVHQFSSFLAKNLNFAAEIGLSFDSTSTSSSSLHPSFLRNNLPAVEEIIDRSARACWEVHRKEFELAVEDDSDEGWKRGRCVQALYSRNPKEWAEAISVLLKPLQREFILSSHQQRAIGGSLQGAAWWTWFERFLPHAVAKNGLEPRWGVYNIGMLSLINLSPDFTPPPLPSFKAPSSSDTKSILLPPPDLNLDSPNLVVGGYVGSGGSGETGYLAAMEAATTPTSLLNLGIRKRMGTHLTITEKTAGQLAESVGLLQQEGDGAKKEIETLASLLKETHGDLYSRGLGRAVCFGGVEVVGSSDASTFTKEEWVVVEEIIYFIVLGHFTSSVLALLTTFGLQPPNTPRDHLQQLLVLKHTSKTRSNFHQSLNLNRSLPLNPGVAQPGGGTDFEVRRRHQQRTVDMAESILRGTTRRIRRTARNTLNMEFLGLALSWDFNHPMVKAGLSEGTAVLSVEEGKGFPSLCNFPESS